MGLSLTVQCALSDCPPAVLSPPSLEAVNTTHHSVELAWHALSQHSPSSRPHYTVQEEEVGRSKGYTNIYRYSPKVLYCCIHENSVSLFPVVVIQHTVWPQVSVL